MNFRLQTNNSVFSGGQSALLNSGLKSTRQKQERQAKYENQIAFFEKQKENLKTMQCDTLEQIARKLDMFNDYEEQIEGLKMAYNNEQMFHVMDEARERGEKIAEQAEKLKPKTAEERREEAAEEAKEEALGTEESDGVLEDLLEESAKMMEELVEESVETAKEMTEQLSEEVAEEMTEQLPEEGTEGMAGDLEHVTKELGAVKSEEATVNQRNIEDQNQYAALLKKYRPMDIRI